jgi:hypothetical protein
MFSWGFRSPFSYFLKGFLRAKFLPLALSKHSNCSKIMFFFFFSKSENLLHKVSTGADGRPYMKMVNSHIGRDYAHEFVEQIFRQNRSGNSKIASKL